MEGALSYLFARDRILHHGNMRELLKALQRVQIRQLSNIVLREDQRCKPRYALAQARLYTRYSNPP